MDKNPETCKEVADQVASGNVPWEDFVWMGSSHFVLPALYSAFRRNGILPLLPEDLAEYLLKIYTINADRNEKITEQALNLTLILNAGGIEPVFLKGAGHLLQNLYHDPADRIMSDIDILIPEDQLPEAAKILYTNGYFHPEEFEDNDFEKHHHLPGFEHLHEVAMVEIHHSVFPGNYQNLLANEEIYAEKMKIEGYNAWVLSAHHQQLLNFVHDQLVDDGFRYKNMVIKGLYDFYLLSKLNQSSEISSLAKAYTRKFNTYCSFASVIFNHPSSIIFTQNSSTRRFKWLFDYLLDHPRISGFYQFIVLYSLRIPIIFKTIIMSPFSKQSRRYFSKKAGSGAALRRYIKSLKEEL